MTGKKIKVQSLVRSDFSDEQLHFVKQMGVDYVYVMFLEEHTDYDSVMKFRERLQRFGLSVTDAGCRALYKSDRIHLGLPGRDEAIERYNNFTRVLGRAGIPITYMTWEPNGMLSTSFGQGRYSHGGITRLVDMDQLKSLSYSHGRFYDREEIWENFKYFLDRALPVCEEANVKIALHPNDPPADSLRGISHLIRSAEDYRKAFALSGDSPYLGMKLCTGCWIEGGREFGNLLEDIASFIARGKVFIVHFRNTSGPMPEFEETLLEDGCMDMYQVMKQLVSCDYDGMITVDHVPGWEASCGGADSALAYSTGYMKALLRCAVAEVNGKEK